MCTKYSAKKICIPDILPSRTISDTVASLRISQFKVGQKITKYIHEQYTKSSSIETVKNDKAFIPAFVKIERLANDTNIILIGGDCGLRVLKNSIQISSDSHSSETELLFEKIDNRSIDASIAVFSTVKKLYILNLCAVPDELDEHQIILHQHDKSEISKKFSGQAIKIGSSRNYILVSLAVTSIRLLHRHTLEQITMITSISGFEVIYASSLRWLAVQVPQGLLSQARDSEANEYDNSSIISAGNAARRVVSGFYSFSKASWNTITPLLQKVCQNPPLNTTKIKSENQPQSVFPFTLTSDTSLTGGAVAIWDMTSTHSQQQPVIIKKFLAHKNNLSCMSFSPSGLRLISADTNGQIILVHALCSSGMLPSPPHLFTSSENFQGKDQVYPVLLYKLVRGITLASISSVGLDASENIAYATSTNGTVHIFDLYHSSVSSRSRSSSMSTTASSSPLSPIPTALHDPFHPLFNEKQIQSSSPSTCSAVLTTVPAQDISQLLQLHPTLSNKLNMGKQLNPDLRIKLPLMPYPCNVVPCNDKNDNNASTTTTSMKLKDSNNIVSSSSPSQSTSSSPPATASVDRLEIQAVLFPYKSQVSYIPPPNSSSFGSSPLHPTIKIETGIEILAVTSEGLLCRYRAPYDPSLQPQLTPQQQQPSLSLPSQLSQPSPPIRVYQVAKEINRWDLTTNIDSLSSNKEIEGTLSSTMEPLSQGYVSKLRQSSNKYQTSVTSTQRWLLKLSDRQDSVDLPYWLRPQITLKKHSHTLAVKQHPLTTEDPSALLDFSFVTSEEVMPPTTHTSPPHTNNKNIHLFLERMKTETLIIRRPFPYLVHNSHTPTPTTSTSIYSHQLPIPIVSSTSSYTQQQQQQYQHQAIRRELLHALQSELPSPVSYFDDPWTKQHYFINELLYPQKYGVMEEFSDDFCDRWDTEIEIEIDISENNMNKILLETNDINTTRTLTNNMAITTTTTNNNNHNNNNKIPSMELTEEEVDDDDYEDDFDNYDCNNNNNNNDDNKELSEKFEYSANYENIPRKALI